MTTHGPKGNLRAVAYVRVSTGKQKEKFSPTVQRREIRKYAATQKPPLTIVESFEEARSGYELKARVKFYEMLDFVKKNNIGHVLYYLTNRVTRNDEDWADLKKLRVRLHNVKEGRAFTPGNKEDRRAKNQEDQDAVDAEKSSIDTSERVIPSQLEKAGRGEYPGNPPLGYLLEPIMVNGRPLIIKKEIKNKTIVDPIQGPLIKKMFEIFASGEANSLRDLNSKMRNLGQRSKTGRMLNLEEVRRYLRTPFYYGTFKWGGKLYPNKGTYEPIISKALFDSVQDILDGRRTFTKRGKEFKYKDLLTCDFCGCRLVGDSHERINEKTGEKRIFIYYRCTGGKRTEWYQEKYKQPKCPLYYGPYYTEEKIDGFFEDAIDLLYIDPGVYDWMRGQLEEGYKNLTALNANELTSLRKEIAHNETTSGDLVEASARAMNDRVRAAYEKRIDDIERRNAEVEARIEELEKGEEAVSIDDIRETLVLSKSLKENYLNASPEKRTKLNRLMFSTVRITKEGWLPEIDEDDNSVTLAPFYFVWNEPFKSLWEIGFIQGMGEADPQGISKNIRTEVIDSKDSYIIRFIKESEKPTPEGLLEEKGPKNAETKKWRGRRDSNSRPPA